ncbi:MAG: hypothetical protein KAJ95_04500 [Gammaproteobacteria bacterium]|nr:hypothetical protein [Gammaproteobacteria bacterium]
MKTIFIQIASYRDTELPFTVESAISKARNPDRLRFGICWQYDEETEADLDQYLDDPRFSIDKIHYQQSQGCCWARNRTNLLYQEEFYTLQIDAHMRFANDWDDKMISMLESTGHEKPLLTTYPPPYTLYKGVETLSEENGVQKLGLKKLRLDLTTLQEGVRVEQMDRPGKNEFIAAGYLFTLGRFCHEVEYDPNIYFLGEEISLAVRAYTHGYNFYYPHENVIWHRYNHDSPLHWTDHKKLSQEKQKAALQRLELLLLGDHSKLGGYGLGTHRSLQQYEQYANICFTDVIERREKKGDVHLFNQSIKLNTFAIEQRNDYECWIFCLLNDEDEEIYREDITDPDMLLHKVDFLEINAEIGGTAVQYMLWPKSPDGWGQKYYYPLEISVSSGSEASKAGNEATIFIALAAYCEPELRQTIDSCLNNAVNPERLRFGICLQYDNDGVEDIHEDCIDDLLSNRSFRIVKYPSTSSRGGCWARNIVQSLYRNEEYTLQIDAHSRMVEGWDEILTNMMHELPSGKPLITGFPPLYFINDGKEEFTSRNDLSHVPTTKIASWSSEGWIHHPTEYIPENDVFPRRTRVISGAFVFTIGQWNVEVNQDPDHLYTGEEFALALRSYTSGYDLYNPSQIVLWHRCHPQPNRKYINDFDQEEVRKRHVSALKRLKILLEGDPENRLEPFSLGRQRSLDSYRIFSGLDCENMTIHENALNGVPPDPVTLVDEYSPAGNQDTCLQGQILDVNIQLSGMQEFELQCEHSSPVLLELVTALEKNTQRKPGDADPMMYLQFADNEDHEVYFLQSRLLSLQVCPVAG